MNDLKDKIFTSYTDFVKEREISLTESIEVDNTESVEEVEEIEEVTESIEKETTKNLVLKFEDFIK